MAISPEPEVYGMPGNIAEYYVVKRGEVGGSSPSPDSIIFYNVVLVRYLKSIILRKIQMTLTQALKEIKRVLKEEGTEEQKQNFRRMGILEIDSMAHIAQSMGVKSAINMFL